MERMVPIFSPAFRSRKSVSGEERQISANELFSVHSKTGALVLLGPRGTCKTSLLFQAGVTAVKEGLHVTFIRPEPFSAMPLQVHGMPVSDPEALALLTMRYPTTAKEFTEYLGCLHENPSPPDLLIVDDVHVYLQLLHQENGHGDAYEILARLCCLLEDAADFMSTKSLNSSPQLIVSSLDVNQIHLPIYEKYLKNIVTMKVPTFGLAGVSMSWSNEGNKVSLGLNIQEDAVYSSYLDVKNPLHDAQSVNS